MYPRYLKEASSVYIDFYYLRGEPYTKEGAKELQKDQYSSLQVPSVLRTKQQTLVG